ncbi:MAG: FtsW/RodA/SpoVE family cell cycle protein, partial [Gemmatimonadaceae bacterium]
MIRRTVRDVPLVTIALLLSFYGIATVYSAGQTDVPTVAHYVWRNQLVWFALGVTGAYVVSRASVRLLEWAAWPAYLLTLVLLITTLVIGQGFGTGASSKSWLVIGGVRLGQPAELAKLTVVLMLARVLASRREAPQSLLQLWQPALIVGIPWLLIMAQPDLGTGIVFIGIFFAMLFWAGVPWPLLILLASPGVSLVLSFSTFWWGGWFLLLLALVLWYRPFLAEGIALVVANVATGVLAPILWDSLAPYQQKRLLVFLNPNVDPRDAGYHVIQSRVAIGSGGWFGNGYLEGTQKRLAFLPEQHTDFIFAVVGEELGFMGVAVALTLFLLLFLRVVRVAQRASEPFSGLVAFGLLASWLVHVIVN